MNHEYLYIPNRAWMGQLPMPTFRRMRTVMSVVHQGSSGFPTWSLVPGAFRRYALVLSLILSGRYCTIITNRVRSTTGRLCFDSCLSICLSTPGGGGYPKVPTPLSNVYLPPGQGTYPHPSIQGTYPLPGQGTCPPAHQRYLLPPPSKVPTPSAKVPT